MIISAYIPPDADKYVSRIDLVQVINTPIPASALMSAVASMVSHRVGLRVYPKFWRDSLSPIKQRRFMRRVMISHAKHPTRSKFKGALKCFRIRFQVMA